MRGEGLPGLASLKDQLSSAEALATATAVTPAKASDRSSEVNAPCGTAPLNSAAPIEAAAIKAAMQVMAMDPHLPR